SWTALPWADSSNSSAVLRFDGAIVCRLRSNSGVGKLRLESCDPLRNVAVVWIARHQLFVRPQRESKRFGIAFALVKVGEIVERLMIIFVRASFDLQRLRKTLLGGLQVALVTQALADRHLAENRVLPIGFDRGEQG